MRLLPDRRRLMEGSGLDLYRDLDVLLVATPDARDGASALLVARHHLADEVLRAGLERAAPAGGRRIEWRGEAAGTVGVRISLPAATAGEDDRRFLLHPGLVALVPGAPPAAMELAARLAVQDGAMPENAILRITTTQAPALPGATAPRSVSLVAGVVEAPFLDLAASFATEDEARGWEDAWLGWQRGSVDLPDPWREILALLAARAKLHREGCAVALRLEGTAGQTASALQQLASILRRHFP